MGKSRRRVWDPSTPLPPASRPSTPLRMTLWFSTEMGEEVDFQLNNETYYIDLADEEGKWLVFAQTPTGVRRIPVYIDAPVAEDLHVLIEDKQSRKVVN